MLHTTELLAKLTVLSVVLLKLVFAVLDVAESVNISVLVLIFAHVSIQVSTNM